MEKLLWEKVWTVNASDVKWVDCEHVNKTGTIVKLEIQIHQSRSKLDLITQTKKQIYINFNPTLKT
jgi:hypothetical protein